MVNAETMACPVCGDALPVTTDTMEAWGAPVVCEEYAECPKGHYWFEWAYGSTRETIGTEEFVWSDKETQEQAKVRRAAVANAIAKTKKATR